MMKVTKIPDMAGAYAQDYIPALKAGYPILPANIQFTQLADSGTEAGVAGSNGTATVTVNHAAYAIFNLNTLPVITCGTANATAVVVPGSVTPSGFQILITNTAGAPQDVAWSYTRVGL
jgi:hypothetical protein